MAASITAPSGRAERRPRVPLPGWINFAATLIILAVVLTLALRAQNAAPPAVAEFAPQAQQIKQAPQEQTSVVGNAPGGAGVAPALPSPSPPPPGVPANAVINHCIGDPPRQIEDPQSPPCVPFWVGNNGGATSAGVTANQITMVGGFPAAMVQFFNTRFELYGRKVVDNAHPSTTASNATADTATQERAQADAEKQQFNPFITSNEQGSSYFDQAARDHMVNTNIGIVTLTEPWLSARAPYVWQYESPFDNIERNFGTWACDRLVGGNATHAGVGTVGKPRVFGLLFSYSDTPDAPYDDAPFVQTLTGCGGKLAFEVVYNDSGGNSTNLTNVITNMKAQGVTSIFCLCTRGDVGSIMNEAENQTYYPEWLVTSYFWSDANFSMHFIEETYHAPADQMAHLFGMTMQPMQRQFQDHPSTWANPGSGYESDTVQVGTDDEYHELLLAMSGIQMAGPNLTPATFQSGLQRALFPNPESPLMEGHVGFNGGTHGMTVDGAEFWYSYTAAGPYPDEAAGSGGAWCYVDHGVRHSIANPWPRGGDPFFQGPCDSGDEPANWSG